ncbi:structure-specific endonuclease subunit SLX4 isoform X2 [Chelmon rostratus]|uniref:structure-specific endonuclease subunit SLX4 isoform X2 n=1 Tax=Chelmon rostratus TaxID=109905 RepID=UPI001BE71680|nr:structure-specific endonuclease subunit SLX4 isoform X2 [Chelmon rostratus]
MDDSDQDFVDLCSKLLKRVRKKPGEPIQPRKADHQPSSHASNGEKRKRNNKRDCAGTQQHVVCGGTGCDSGDAASSAVPAAAGPKSERDLTAKDKVLQRMQQFKRASPQRMEHKDKSQTTNHENDSVPAPPLVQRQDASDSLSSGHHVEPLDSDEALALRMQQELDREAAQAQTVDLEDGALFFCQICHRDLSHMTPQGRTQHLNRCLDESEESGPGPPPRPPPPGVPDCPICGKKFKSQKSRSAHLKRCSSVMGVPPAVLLQALQRQAEETQNVPTANVPTETGGTKRKGPSKSGVPARKKPKKKTEPLDEDTMVAMALSSSLMEQEGESERPLQIETAASHTSMTAVLKWRTDAGKGRGKRKKGGIPRPPPLLLVQDAEAAQTRLQERVSALLLRSRAPSPPTPPRRPSSLLGWSGAAPLWQKSTLLDGGSTCLSDFYTPELREFISPWALAATDAASCSNISKAEPSVQSASEGAPVTRTTASILPSSSQTAAASTGTEQLPVGSQTLRDLMDLAEDGMTPTQCGYPTSGPNKENSASLITSLHLSGFVPEESEEQADLCASSFLLERTQTHPDDIHSRARRTTDRPGADHERGSHRSVALSRLASDLSSMVNNPQLSDVQLQVDSGEVYFAHSFMVYARCPLLAEMVHECGFGVKEEGMPASQRVLMSDVPGQAVFALLHYLYTAHSSIPPSLQPHVLELASRFDLPELKQLCELHREDVATQGAEGDFMNQEENFNNQTDQAFLELLHSMWNDEEEDNEGMDTEGGSNEERGLEEDRQADDLTAGDREICEEKVNEEELEEIYEFAATQRKKEEEKDSMEEEEEEKVDEKENGEEVFLKLTEPKRSSTGLQLHPLLEPDPSLDRSYSRLFSDSWGVYEEGNPSSLPSTSGQSKTHTPHSQKHESPHKPSSQLSGRALLQSSASAVEDLSLSPPTSSSNLPVPGQSPGQESDSGTDALDLAVPEEGLPLKRESHGPRSICVHLSPDSPQKNKEPELIVLSDSSDEMEVVLSSHSPSPHSPCTIQNPQSYTQIKQQPTLKPNGRTPENQKSSSLEFSPESPSAALVQSHPGSGCDQSPVDCSPEVSWLIPSTPLQHGRSTTTSSTQTKSSMCRTQLFPKGDSSSSVFSSPALPFTNKLQTSNSSVSAHVGPTESSVPRLKLDETVPCSSSFDLNFCPERTSSCDVSKPGGVFPVPLSKSKSSHPLSSVSKQDTPLHPQPRPYSSTPMNTELHQLPVLLATSPLHSNLYNQRSTIQGRDRASSDSPEKSEPGSFHLSSLSDPSDPPSSSSPRGLQSSQRLLSSCQSQPSVEPSSHDNAGGELTRRGERDEDREIECKNKDMGDEGEQEEATGENGVTEVAESSFQQSFMAMDEPPIAFNDSWGLDVCADANPGCFSLRLEDSRGSSQQERSPGQRETARSSYSTDCQLSPPSVRLMNSHSSVTAPSLFHSSQPSTSIQAHTGPSVTPSAPGPTTRTTPEINNSLLDSKIWDSWEEEEEEEEEEEALPLSQKVNPSAQLKTPASSHNKRRRTLVPITPLPHYSDMDTPELKNKLNRFGVRPLPKRQMILKLKEIHQYTHQLVSSDSEDEAPSAGCTAQMKPPPRGSVSAGNKLVSCAQKVRFKEPGAPAASSSLKHSREEEAELLSASQGSNTSSTAASEESERSNPELCLSSDGDSDSDGGISASQVATRLQDRLRAVRSFILSESELYTQILQYQPLVLSQLQERLKAAGIRLGAAKLADYLDSQCITFTTAKQGHSAPGHRRGKKTGKRAKAAGESGAGRKKGLAAMH